MAASLDPTTLDQQAAVLYDTAAWQAMVDGWHATTTPTTGQPTTDLGETGTSLVDPVVGEKAASPAGAVDLVAAVPGLLLTLTVTELIADAGITTGPAPADRQLPGRIAALAPDRLHTWRRLYQPDLKPSVQLDWAQTVLREWGWQNRPYRLRSLGGARCVCGAILAAERLGYGSHTTAERSATYVLGELRARGWQGLIGEWNRQPGRTADQAIALVAAAGARAAAAGY